MAKKWWTLTAVSTGTFMLLLDVTIVSVALPDIQRDLGASFGELQWVADVYALALASLLLTSGALADRFGRRRVFLTGLVVFTAASLLCGLAHDPALLIVSRGIQGIGGAMLFATSLALLAGTFHGRERGVAFGVWGAVTGIATALGPILGGLITTGIGWRGIFVVNVPVGVFAVVLTVLTVGETRASHARRIDWLGMTAFTLGLAALVYGLTEAGEESWGAGIVLGAFAAAAVLLTAFVLIERSADEPMFDLSLLRVPTFLGGSVAAFAMNGSLFAMLIYLVIYLQNSLGYSAMETGVRLLVMSGTTMVVATAAGRLSSRVPVRWLIGPGLLLVGVGLTVMTGLSADSSWTHLVPGLLIAGIGSGLVNPPLASTAVGVVPIQRSGMASGANNTFRQVGIAVGIAVYGSLFSSHLRSSMADSLAGSPLAGRAEELAGAIRSGATGEATAGLPVGDRSLLEHAAHTAMADAMNTLLVTSGAVALVGGVLAAVLIRSRDFLDSAPASGTDGAPRVPVDAVS
ncbi:MAG: MFS transporter [Gordonia sp. (in: high G+C Gram-positive bacteria)]|uniref:MFS transporter n=1 Tax=Gordonia sp. (in: high G+C Gram-positive bacteria) TaxID=84139 RepID=UPI0039E6F70C